MEVIELGIGTTSELLNRPSRRGCLLILGRPHAIGPNSVRETRRIRDSETNDPFREIGVGILARADSRETASR